MAGGAHDRERPSGGLDAIAEAEEPAPAFLDGAADAVVGDLDRQQATREEARNSIPEAWACFCALVVASLMT